MIGHSYKMVIKNVRAYSFLSVSIILSFSLLIGYFLYMDSVTYNDHKYTFALPANILSSHTVYEEAKNNRSAYNTFFQKIREIGDTEYIDYYDKQVSLDHYGLNVTIFYMPDNWNDLFPHRLERLDGHMGRLSLIEGRQTFENPNEIVVSKSLYKLVKETNENKELTLTIPNDHGVSEYKIIGVMENRSISGLDIYMSNFNTKYFNDFNHRIVVVDSKYPLEVLKIARDLEGVPIYSAVEAQINAMRAIQGEVFMKGVVSVILFFLLSLNLYSSFNNVLNERRFEIGIKRAIGASKKNIIFQFIFESLYVMFFNMFVSVIIVLNVGLFFKLYNFVFLNQEFILYLSLYSLIILLTVIIILSTIFSVLFAYKSTQVEVIGQLKVD